MTIVLTESVGLGAGLFLTRNDFTKPPVFKLAGRMGLCEFLFKEFRKDGTGRTTLFDGHTGEVTSSSLDLVKYRNIFYTNIYDKYKNKCNISQNENSPR
jgi:hypothetical protein